MGGQWEYPLKSQKEYPFGRPMGVPFGKPNGVPGIHFERPKGVPFERPKGVPLETPVEQSYCMGIQFSSSGRPGAFPGDVVNQFFFTFPSEEASLEGKVKKNWFVRLFQKEE